MRRWSIRIFVGLLLLLAVVIVVVQLVLWSSLPKKIVIAQIEKELGLRISADALTTNWFGHSTLTNVSLGLPLSAESFLGVRELHIKHNTLIGLALGRAISVDSIEVDQPVVQVRQDAQGNLNVIEVAQLLARVLGSNTAQQSTAQQGIPKLPTVKLVDGTVKFTDNKNRSSELQHVNLDGYAADALVWKYDLKAGDQITASGELAPGGVWKHKVNLAAHNIQPLVDSFGLLTYRAAVKVEWTGQLDGDVVNGRLTFQQATAQAVPGAGDVSATGAVDVSAAGGVITVRPQRLQVQTGSAMVRTVQVAAGTLTQDASGIHLQAIQVGALGGLAVVDGQMNLKTFSGDMRARWNGLGLPGGLSHSGSLTASLKMPFTDHPVIDVDLISHGRRGADHWDANVKLSGVGESWKNIEWVLTAPQLGYYGSRSIELAALTGHVSQRLPVVRLDDLSLPARPHLQSQGQFNTDTLEWYVYLDAGGTPAKQTTLPITFSVDAWGNKDRLVLKAMNAQAGPATAWAGGYYELRQPKPVHLDIYLNQSAPQFATTANAPVQGHATGNFHIGGDLGKTFESDYSTLDPSLDISGKLVSSDLIVLNKPIGDINLQVTGSVANKHAHLRTTELMLFQGRWNFQADYPAHDNRLFAELDVDELPLAELAKFVNVQGISGQLTHASWAIDAQPADLNSIHVSSHYALRDIAHESVPVLLNQVTADGTVADGIVSLKPINITSGAGKIDGSLSLDLHAPDHVRSEFHVHQFPFASGNTAVVTSADTKLDIALNPLGITGPVTATTDINYGALTLVHATLDSQMHDRIVTIKNLGGNVLSGTFQGDATFDFDTPLQANGQIRWYNVDAGALVAIAPGLNGLGGKYAGTVTIAPARDPKPIAPVRVDVNVATPDGHFKTVRIGDNGLFAIHAVGYADVNRFILDHSDIHVADGLAHLWARIDRGQNAVLSFDHLDLDQLAHVVDTIKGPYPGLVAGQFTVAGSGVDLNRIIGGGKVTLTHSDLANFGPLALLYAIANAGGSPTPIGYGTVGMNFEQKVLKVTEFRYFNRGIDATGRFKVGPLAADIQQTPVTGQVIGTAQVLKNSRVQILTDVNDLLATAQSALATVGVDGVVGDPHPYPSSIAALGSTFQEIITGDTRAEIGTPNNATTAGK